MADEDFIDADGHDWSAAESMGETWVVEGCGCGFSRGDTTWGFRIRKHAMDCARYMSHHSDWTIRGVRGPDGVNVWPLDRADVLLLGQRQE